MIDLTLNQEDKKNFIRSVGMSKDNTKLVILYADGHIEEEDFDIEKINDLWRIMEQDFWQYRDDFVKQMSSNSIKAILSSIFEAILGVGSIYLTSSIDMPISLKILIIVFVICCSLYYQKICSYKTKISNYFINKVMIIEEFLKHKDVFKVDILNPLDGKMYDWYFLSLSKIEEIENFKMLDMIAKALTPEVKEEEAKEIEKKLRKVCGH